jgi:hypothetical protein
VFLSGVVAIHNAGIDSIMPIGEHIGTDSQMLTQNRFGGKFAAVDTGPYVLDNYSLSTFQNTCSIRVKD